MATLTIRNVDDDIKAKIREQAARHGVSMEEEVRRILIREFLKPIPAEKDIMTQIREKFAERGIKGIDFEEIPIPPRDEYMTESSIDFSDFYPDLDEGS